jgi:hypothetical protein
LISQKHQRHPKLRNYKRESPTERRTHCSSKMPKTSESAMMFNQSAIYPDMWDGHVTSSYTDKRRSYCKELKSQQPFTNLAKHLTKIKVISIYDPRFQGSWSPKKIHTRNNNWKEAKTSQSCRTKDSKPKTRNKESQCTEIRTQSRHNSCWNQESQISPDCLWRWPHRISCVVTIIVQTSRGSLCIH